MGAISSFAANAKGADLAAKQGRLGIKDTDNWLQKAAKIGARGAGAGFSGLFGAATGIGAGTAAAYKAKSDPAKAAMDAMSKRRAEAIASGAAGSTLWGRTKSTVRQALTGEGLAAAKEREIANNKARIEALKGVKARVSAEMVKQDWTAGVLAKKDTDGNIVSWLLNDTSGHAVDGAINYKDFLARLEAAPANAKTIQIATWKTDSKGKLVRDSSGNLQTVMRTVSKVEAERFKGLVLKVNENDYLVRNIDGTADSIDQTLLTRVGYANSLGGSAGFERHDDGTIDIGDNVNITDRASVNDAIDAFEDRNAQLTRENELNKANDRYSANKKS